MNNQLKLECRLALGVLSVFLGAGSALAQTSERGATSAGALDEIVVSAQRRQANLQNVPVAVSAFSGEDLARRQITSLVDIARDVPNLIGHNNVGLNTATVVFLRGVGSTQSFATVDTTVGFYVDDVYIARQNANNFQLFDVESIEVLRGPQGTLYGRNTSGGAIKVNLARPNDEFAVRTDLGFGSYDRIDLKGSLNVPLSENLFMRLNGASQQQDRGFSRNETLGERVNDRSIEAARAAFLYLPTADLEVLFSVDWVSDDAQGIVPADISGRARPVSASLFDVASGIENFNEVMSRGATLDISWQTDAFTFRSISSYRELRQFYQLDLTDQPVPIYYIDNDGEHDQFSQELQIQGDATIAGNAVRWIAGAFYMKEWNTTVIGDAINFQLPSGVRLPLGRQFKVLDNDVDSYAVFGEATWQLTDALGFTLGLRYTRDVKDVDVVQFNAAGVVTYDTQTLVSLGIPIKQTFNEVTPRLGMEWQFNDDILFYGNYTKGFKSGGWNSRVTNAAQFYAFEPEFVTAYEVGMKSEWLDRRLRVNTAAFWSDVEDLVLGTAGTTADGAFQTLNSDADIYGLELEATALVTSSLDVFLTLGLMDARYKNLGEDPQGFRGRRLPRVSDMTLKLGAEQSWDLVSGALVTLGADYSQTSPYYSSAGTDRITRVGTVELVNMYLRYDAPDEKWYGSLGCRNCFDKEYFHSMLNFPVLGPSVGFAAAYPGDPATWMVNFGTRF
jgi:iron complex outermembrane receptor protein